MLNIQDLILEESIKVKEINVQRSILTATAFKTSAQAQFQFWLDSEPYFIIAV